MNQNEQARYLNRSHIFGILEPLRMGDTGLEPPQLSVEESVLRGAWDELLSRLACLPAFHKAGYAAHMQKPPHPVAVSAYIATLLSDPNNYTRESGGATLDMERETISALTRMVGYASSAGGHLTGSGSIANLEALWTARELRPGKKVALSDQVHHSHLTACRLLGLDTVLVKTDDAGRMDLSALESALQRENIGVVIVTAGTTGLGAIDPIEEVVKLRARYGFCLHADACHGGFYALLSKQPNPLVPAAPFAALSECDSVAIDPHKHGLQPIGCGCLLLREHSASFVSSTPAAYIDESARGDECRVECSRSGAAAAALWFTLKCFPLEPERGFGPILAASLRAARRFSTVLKESSQLSLFVEPELDIVSFFPLVGARTASALDSYNRSLVRVAREASDSPLYLSTLAIESARLRKNHPGVAADVPLCRIVRAVFMKPEQEHSEEAIYRRLAALIQQLPR